MKKEDILKYINEAFKETKEATGASSAGGFSSPAFSMWSEDDEAKGEYKRMDGEFKEATTSSSVGAYDAPGFQDVNMKGNTLKGKGTSWTKTQLKGGAFVEIDPKCKTFPYCNQGNTGAVKYRKPKKNIKKSPLSEAIDNVSIKTGLSVETIKKILLHKINSNL
jgi:hypothetical protein